MRDRILFSDIFMVSDMKSIAYVFPGDLPYCSPSVSANNVQRTSSGRKQLSAIRTIRLGLRAPVYTHLRQLTSRRISFVETSPAEKSRHIYTLTHKPMKCRQLETPTTIDRYHFTLSRSRPYVEQHSYNFCLGRTWWAIPFGYDYAVSDPRFLIGNNRFH